MAAREERQLVVTVDPADATVHYTSSNTDVATVSNTGLVTGVGNGDAIITITAGGMTATCSVSVQHDI